MFRITQGKGFQVTFDNGWTVSVQFGPGNYCENRDLSLLRSVEDCESSTAEIAAWPEGAREPGKSPCDNWHVFKVYTDDETGEVWGKECVKGWCKADEVLVFMAMIASKPKQEPMYKPDEVDPYDGIADYLKPLVTEHLNEGS